MSTRTDCLRPSGALPFVPTELPNSGPSAAACAAAALPASPSFGRVHRSPLAERPGALRTAPDAPGTPAPARAAGAAARLGAAAFVPPPPCFKVSVQTGSSKFDFTAIDAARFAALAPALQRRYLMIVTDPAIRGVAEQVSAARGGPVPIVLTFSERISHHYAETLFIAPPGRGDDAEAFRRTVVHEMGHDWQNVLYGHWLADVDYTARNPLERHLGDGHWPDKATTAGAAWVEGYAEALATRHVGDDSIGRFDHRRTILTGPRGGRALDELAAVEGYVAAVLVDFWGAKGTPAFARTQQVLRLQDPRDQAERHKNLDEYLNEHVRRFPEDRLRLHLALQGNSLLRAAAPGASSDAALTRLDAGLRDLSARHGAENVAHAIHRALHRASSPASAADALAAVAAEVQQLARNRTPAFINLLAVGKDLERMPLDALRAELDSAEQAFRNAMTSYGYDFHPAVKDPKEHYLAVKTVYERRAGKPAPRRF